MLTTTPQKRPIYHHQSVHCKRNSQGCSSAESRSATANSGTKPEVLPGMIRYGTFPLLFAFQSLSLSLASEQTLKAWKDSRFENTKFRVLFHPNLSNSTFKNAPLVQTRYIYRPQHTHARTHARLSWVLRFFYGGQSIAQALCKKFQENFYIKIVISRNTFSNSLCRYHCISKQLKHALYLCYRYFKRFAALFQGETIKSWPPEPPTAT